MLILVEGINKENVESQAKMLCERLNVPIVLDAENLDFLAWVQLIKNNNDCIIINSFVKNQSDALYFNKQPSMSNSEIIAISALAQSKMLLYYVVEDDVEWLYEQNKEQYADEEDFKKHLKAYNCTCGYFKTLFPVVAVSFKDKGDEILEE